MSSTINEIKYFLRDASQAIILKDFWIDKRSASALICMITLNLLKSCASIMAPVFLSYAVEDMTKDEIDEDRVIQYLFIWAGMLGGEQFLKALNGLVISFIQTRLSEELIGEQYLTKLHHMPLPALEQHLSSSETNLAINAARESSALLSKVIHEFFPLIFNVILTAIVLHVDTKLFKRPSLSPPSLSMFWLYSLYNLIACIGYSYALRHATLEIGGKAESFTQVFFENMNHISVIKLKCHEDSYLRNAKRLFFNMTNNIFSSDAKPAWYKLIVIKGAYLGVCIGMIQLITNGKPTKDNFDELVLILNYTFMFHNLTEGLGLNILATRKGIIYLQKIKAILDSPDETISTTANTFTYCPPGVPTIEFRNVSLTLNGNDVLKNINFKIYPGQSCAFVGKSGSGKSSIIKLICGFYIPTSGEILINGTRIDNIPINHLRCMITLASQYTKIFRADIAPNASCLKYNVFFGHMSSQQLYEYQHSGALTSNEDALFQQLQTDCILNMPEELKVPSGGEEQRVGLARGLDSKNIIILDEPTSALDSITEAEIIGNVNRFLSKRPPPDRGVLIMTGHRLRTIKGADIIFVLENNTISEMGNHLALNKIPNGFYNRYYKTQMRTPSFGFFDQNIQASDSDNEVAEGLNKQTRSEM